MNKNGKSINLYCAGSITLLFLFSELLAAVFVLVLFSVIFFLFFYKIIKKIRREPADIKSKKIVLNIFPLVVYIGSFFLVEKIRGGSFDYHSYIYPISFLLLAISLLACLLLGMKYGIFKRGVLSKCLLVLYLALILLFSIVFLIKIFEGYKDWAEAKDTQNKFESVLANFPQYPNPEKKTEIEVIENYATINYTYSVDENELFAYYKASIPETSWQFLDYLSLGKTYYYKKINENTVLELNFISALEDSIQSNNSPSTTLIITFYKNTSAPTKSEIGNRGFFFSSPFTSLGSVSCSGRNLF
jgi:hypothetical protein